MRFSEYVAIKEYFCRNVGLPIESDSIHLALFETEFNQKKIMCYDAYELAENPFMVSTIIAKVVVDPRTHEVLYYEEQQRNEPHYSDRGAVVSLYPMPSSLRYRIQQKNRLGQREDLPWPFEEGGYEVSHPSFYWKSDAFLIH